MTDQNDRITTSAPSGATSLKAMRGDNDDWKRWALGALAVAAIVILGFFALGGDADIDVDSGNVDIDLPEVDVDVDAPDIDIEAPDIDIDPGDISIEEGDAEADVDDDGQ